MAEEGQPCLTINLLPTEIIERFAPDLRPQTVSNLRLVSKRFRDVFSADRYYRVYLWYADRLEKYDGELEEIGKKNRWRRCLEAEKRHMNNWKQGQTKRVDKVQVPSNLSPAGSGDLFFWQGTIGEKNRFWMMAEAKGQKVILANLTGDPILAVIDVSSYTDKVFDFACILPDRIMFESNTGCHRVFNILSDGKNLSLEFAFSFETKFDFSINGYMFEDTLEVSISGRSNLTGKFTSLYISYKHPGIWTVWDLKKGVLLKDIVLNNLSLPNLHEDFNNMHLIRFCKCDFPYVSACFTVMYTDKSLFLVVDVDKRRIAYYYWDMHPYIAGSDVKGNTVLLSLRDSQYAGSWISVYDLRKHPVSNPNGDKFHLLFQSDVTNSRIRVAYEPPMLIAQLVDEGRVVCTHIGDPDNIRSEISLQGMDIKTLNVSVGPYFLLEVRPLNERVFRMWTWDRFGNGMFDWTEMLTMNGVFREMRHKTKTSHFTSLIDTSSLCMEVDFEINKLSKCIVQNKNGRNLFICYF